MFPHKYPLAPNATQEQYGKKERYPILDGNTLTRLDSIGDSYEELKLYDQNRKTTAKAKEQLDLLQLQ